jgi:hypothetical protein
MDDKYAVRFFKCIYSQQRAVRQISAMNISQCAISGTGFPMAFRKLLHVEFVSSVIAGLSQEKAAGLNDITAKHLQNFHPWLWSTLQKISTKNQRPWN